MPKISIVIPCYNAGKYLEESLDSILHQTFNDIEIICINDGSTDSTLERLTDYEKKDKRIKVINQKNQGAAIARNNGLKTAVSDYILFFDADDLMKPECLENLYNTAILYNSDVTLCKSYQFFDNNLKDFSKMNYSINTNCLNSKYCFSPKEISKYIFQFCIGWPWDKLYKKQFLLDNNLLFPNLKHTEDSYFVYMSLVYANSISYTDKFLIYHRYHSASLSHTREKHPECFYYALKLILNELKRKNIYKTYEQSFINYCVTFPKWHIDTIKNIRAKCIMINLQKKLLEEIGFKTFDKSYFYNQETYQKVKTSSSIKFILQQIFSVTTQACEEKNKKYKVITILGLKIKIKQ